MTSARLSGLDASFLAVETPTAPMHVGWIAEFNRPDKHAPPSYEQLREHIARRLGRAPRYRQKLAPVPLGLHSPEWIDDPGFDISSHLHDAPPLPLHDLVDQIMSMPLRRDRPLWELWIARDPNRQSLTLVGKAHHCMVDGIAAVQLASLLLDPTPEPDQSGTDAWLAAPEPDRMGLLLKAIGDRTSEQLGLLRWPLKAAAAPTRTALELAGNVPRVARTLRHVLRAAPPSQLNKPLSPLRRLAWTQRPLEDLRKVKRAYGTTINDVLLAAVAGGLRTYQAQIGQQPGELKAMVPVNVRDGRDQLGNHISFVFAELPCAEPDPVRRLRFAHAAMTERKLDGDPQTTDLALKAAEYAPTIVQHAISRAVASPRTFNLVVSNIPGPTLQLYMLGCPLQAAYPVVPLADEHALSIGMTTVNNTACLGIYTDPQALPDSQRLAHHIDAEITDLLATT